MSNPLMTLKSSCPNTNNKKNPSNKLPFGKCMFLSLPFGRKIILAEIILTDDTCPCVRVQDKHHKKSTCSSALFRKVRMVIVSTLGWINREIVEMLCSGSS